tara:strand:- start:472 stop:1221 length:750 start_codon:yes stop_codon:yes gene_type:complete
MSGPIPLRQINTGGGGGMMIALVVCCLCSLISSVVGFIFRDKIPGLGGKSSETLKQVSVNKTTPRSPRPSVPRRRSSKRIRRKRPFKSIKRRFGRKARRIGRKIGKSKVGRKAMRGIRKIGKSKFGRKFKRIGRRRRCFAPETQIKLQNGETRAIKDLELGDVLINGSVVKATMKIKNESDPYYKLPGDILVTGSHYVKDGDTYKQVKNFSQGEVTTQIDPVVSCLVTDDHKIPVGDFVFWDWEDNLIV